MSQRRFDQSTVHMLRKSTCSTCWLANRGRTVRANSCKQKAVSDAVQESTAGDISESRQLRKDAGKQGRAGKLWRSEKPRKPRYGTDD